MDGVDWDTLPPQAQEEIMNGGAGIAPAWAEVHLGNPPTSNTMTLIVLGISLFIVSLVVFIRAYAKLVVAKRVRVEDAFGFIAFLAIIAHAWSIVKMSQEPGLYVHAWDIRVSSLKNITMTMNLLRSFYSLFQLFAKNAILLEWVHIFVPRSQRTRFWWLCWAMIVANTMLYVSFIMVTHLRCVPQRKMWIPWVKGTCINLQATDITVMSFNLICDVLILLLPQGTIWTLNLKRKQKIGLSFLFSLGLLVCGCAAGRVHATVDLDYIGDWIYDVPVIIVWGVGESTFVMMVFCMPAAPQAFKGEGTGLASRLGKSLGSWARMATGGGSSRTRSRGQHTDSTAPTTSRSYHKMDEGSQVALTEVAPAARRSASYKAGDSRITKTTEVVTTENAADWGQARHAREPQQQHPWT